jgi:predicted amidohydrolase YtcJ
MKTIKIASLLLFVFLAACSEKAIEQKVAAAHRVFINGVIYTADDEQRVVSALAVRDGTIAYVGDEAGAARYIGDDTVVVDLDGKMILPGLHDMHIHAMAIIDQGGCDLHSTPMTLAQLAEVVSACVETQELATGQWLSVDQWNFTRGNQPDAQLQTLRQALDVGAPENPVILWGNDGHHSAVNSAALARALNEKGEAIGINAASLADYFAEYRETIGVDAQGEPNGELNETARELVQPPLPLWDVIPDATVMPLIANKLAENGITSIQDAAVLPDSLDLYRSLADSGNMTFRFSAALFQNVKHYIGGDGTIDVAAMLKKLETVREEYRGVPYITVETAKVFVDGVIEGNPLNNPPSLPNAAVLQPYKQPVFKIDLEQESAEITAYVDPAGEACQLVNASSAHYETAAAATQFQESYGFHPGQCLASLGVLENSREFILEYMQALDKSGFNIHAHVIGDRAVRTALDGFDLAESANGKTSGRHSLGHIQLVSPEDYKRIGERELYLVFTYAWIGPDFYYDLTVIPFIEELKGLDELYNSESYYMQNVYPARQLQALGGILAAGSDAPVDTREPRPFVNIQQAVSRDNDQGQVMNPAGSIDIRSALDAYTINGARLFGHDDITGSLVVGKLADLVVVDRDLIALAEAGQASAKMIADTRVLMTLFEGQLVYENQ